ncbi:MAG: hypothetical protein K0R18_62 [Bacillales bacterium]|jgi:hypothetical protein|nr:hypothetical protein [Bacillales bacterium]
MKLKNKKVKNPRSPKAKTLRFFLLSFALICLFSLSTIWINFFQLKSATEADSYKLSKLITMNAKDRYEGVNKFVLAVEPFVADTMKSILLSMETEIKSIGTVDNTALQNLKKEYNITNIYVLDDNGMVKYSTDSADIGLNSASIYKDRTDTDWNKIFNDVLKNKEIYVDKFSQSPKYPYDFNKLAYKGVGYIDKVGFIVLEISLSVSDIKDPSVIDLIGSLKTINEDNENIIDIRFENSPPGTNSKNYFDESSTKVGNQYVTKMNVTNINNDVSQIAVTTKFDEITRIVTAALYNAFITSVFITLFIIIVAILFYYRFSLPSQQSPYKEALERTIRELEQITKK